MLFAGYSLTELYSTTYFNCDMLKVQIATWIRQGFDKARTELEAESYIQIAKIYGLFDLESEMRIDLATERSCNAA